MTRRRVVPVDALTEAERQEIRGEFRAFIARRLRQLIKQALRRPSRIAYPTSLGSPSPSGKIATPCP
jgi:hypothetical protein